MTPLGELEQTCPLGESPVTKERSKNNLRKFIAGLEKRWDSIDQLSQIVFETFLSVSSEDR